MLLRNIDNNLNIERFKSFYHSWQFKILQDLYHQDISDKTVAIKAAFLAENVNKNNLELFSTLKQLDSSYQYKRYYEKLIALLMYKNIDEEAFQIGLEKINEKTEKRKGNGVYYTPDDVSSFIVLNSFNILSDNSSKLVKDISKKVKTDFTNLSVLDPTCGTGAFLIKAFDIKVDLIKKKYGKISDELLLAVIKSLYGNDIDEFSTYISQTRILFKAINLSSTIDINKVLLILKKNFFNFDFLKDYSKIKNKFDFIVGNPPYVEKSKILDSHTAKYGNIYADVVENSLSLLKMGGVMGYIIPLSYISTPRFSKLRRTIKTSTDIEYVLSFADRPDCLFSGVHQKLNIVLARKKKSKTHNVYTSDYVYWYKHQRKMLFDDISLVKNNFEQEAFYPKLGNEIERQIYKKVTSGKNNINSLMGGAHKLYVNMRATFWLKSFVTEPYKSSEYKEFLFDEKNLHFVNIILNSSLFWWLWVKSSDCWHLTNKELSLFSISNLLDIDYKKAKHLSLLLNDMLENTKEKVNTKQTMFEYKHKKCKEVIDLIDDYLADICGLSLLELNYIKHYKESYRLGQADV